MSVYDLSTIEGLKASNDFLELIERGEVSTIEVRNVIHSNAKNSNPFWDYYLVQIAKAHFGANLGILCDSSLYHCLEQSCYIFCELIESLELAPSNLQTISDFVFDQLRCFTTCSLHCCNLVKLFSLITTESTIDKIINSILSSDFLFTKRCSYAKSLQFLICHLEKSSTTAAKQKIYSWAWTKPETHINRISQDTHAFGGCVQKETSFKCDAILLRKLMLLFLKTLAFNESIESHELEERMLFIRRTVINQQIIEGDNDWDWLITLFVDEDCELLTATLFYIKLLRGLSKADSIHSLMFAFLESIRFDATVLVDWLASDEDTALPLLQVLLNYLKLDDIKNSSPEEVRMVLCQLHKKVNSLTRKGLFPYNTIPLQSLLQKLE